MVSALIKIISKKVDGIKQAAFFIGFFVLLSQILALVRDRLLAFYIGPGETLDVYYAAFRIPDILFVTVASLISVASVVPHFAEKYIKDGTHTEAKKLLDSLFTFFVIFLFFVGVVLFIFMPQIVSVIVPGFSEDQIIKTISLSRVMLISPLLLGVSNLFGSVTQYFRRFAVFGLSPVLYNLGIVIGIVFFLPIFGVEGLALGVVLGGILHLVIQLPVLMQEKMIPSFVSKINFGGVKEVVASSLPRTLALSFSTLVMVALVSMSTTISTGAVSLLQFSYNLQSVPLAIIGMSFSVAAFPALATSFAMGDKNKFSSELASSFRQIIFWALPVMVLFVVLRAHIVRVILGTNNFTWDSTKIVAATLSLFVISVVAQSIVMLMSRAFYATKKTIWPLICNGVSSIIIIILAVYFVYVDEASVIFSFLLNLFNLENVPQASIIMLAFSFSVGSILNLMFLTWSAKKYLEFDFFAVLNKSLLKTFAGSVVLGVTTYSVLYFSSPIFGLSTLSQVFFQGLLAGSVGILFYLVSQEFFGSDEYKSVRATLKKKIIGEPAIAPETTLN